MSETSLFSIIDVQFAVEFYDFLKLRTWLLWRNSHADFTFKHLKALLNDGSSVMGLRIFSFLFILINHLQREKVITLSLTNALKTFDICIKKLSQNIKLENFSGFGYAYKTRVGKIWVSEYEQMSMKWWDATLNREAKLNSYLDVKDVWCVFLKPKEYGPLDRLQHKSVATWTLVKGGRA